MVRIQASRTRFFYGGAEIMWKRIGSVLQSLAAEAGRVSWPGIGETMHQTCIVLLAAGFTALLVAAYDAAAGGVISALLTLAG